MKLFSYRRRPAHLGPLPIERLPRLADPSADPPGLDRPRNRLELRSPAERRGEGSASAGHAFEQYVCLYEQSRDGPIAPAAPIPDDPGERTRNLKAGLYFLDADLVGCGPIPIEAWSGERRAHPFALTVVVAHSRDLGEQQPGEAWISGTRQAAADLRAAELAVITASYIRHLGHHAVAHVPSATELDLQRVALQAGVVEVDRGRIRAPFLPGGFALAAVSTDLTLLPDGPLARRGWAAALRSTRSPAWLLGWGGARAGLRRLSGDHRPLHMGRYPMERIRRVDQPTTRVDPDRVPRVPKRAAWFERARQGDLGTRFQREREVFAYKTPQAQSYLHQIRAMVPLQDGPVAVEIDPTTSDPDRNADAVKALAHHLGADMVGVCTVPPYAWFSHREDGSEIQPYHRNAIVMLLDQGHETMEGASGDDWVSGAQSMRAYMRGAQIAGIVAEHLRSLGWSSRSQTNADSDVLHIPLVLHAGLGELSRIGELVLNPFVGPRFKSVVVTTDLPLTADRHIDFGLQDFCSTCTKCARECPCGAISFGDGPIMFNGYEIWKPDVEKCTKYRLGNQKGAACGRCMKTCPFNIEGILAERAFLWAAIKVPPARRWIARLDDRLGNGSINHVKKWWWDLEWKDGRASHPEHGTNARALDMQRDRIGRTQRIAVYPAEANPSPTAVAISVKPDRAAAVAYGESLRSSAHRKPRSNEP